MSQQTSNSKPTAATTSKNAKRQDHGPVDVDKLLDKYSGNYRNYGNKDALQ
jgi:hypothetical protein